MEEIKRKKYYNLCNPYKTLPADSKEVIDIDHFMVDGHIANVRGKRWANDIAKKIIWSEEESAQVIYFSGYTGSGKTTELQRVKKLLEDDGWLPVYINVTEYVDINDTINEIDIFSTIVYHTHLEIAKYKKEDVKSRFGNESYFGRLWTWLNETDVTLKDVEYEQMGAKLVLEMKDRPNFRRRIKMHMTDHYTRFKKDVMDEMTKLNEEVKNYQVDGHRKKGIVVILDSLEKNRGVGTHIDAVAESIERVFANRDNVALPVHTIYTIPAYLSTRGIGEIEFLPVVKVRTKDGKPYKDGIDVMKALVYERIPKEDLIKILGNELLLDKIILFSGGYPRDLLQLLQKAIIKDEYPVKEEGVEKLFKGLENEYQEKITSEHKDVLLSIHNTSKLDFSNHDHRRTAYELFNSHVILRYHNDDLWFALHPASFSILGIEPNDRT